MEQEKSKSDICKEFIEAKLNENFDFSNPKLRTQALQEVIAQNKKIDGFTEANVKSTFYSALKKTIEKKGGDPRTYGLKVKPRATVQSDMVSNIKPKPKATTPNPQETTRIGEPPHVENAGEVMQQPEQTVLIDLDTTKYTIKFAYDMVRMLKYKEWTSLTEKEEEALGKAWLAIFQQYLQGQYAKWIVPLFISGSILIAKQKESMDKKPKKTEEDRKPEIQQKQQQKKENDSKAKRQTAGWLGEIGVDEDTLNK